MKQISLVQANTAVQLGKEVTKLLCVDYTLIGDPFAIDHMAYQMVMKGSDVETPGRSYDVVIRYGDITMVTILSQKLEEGWEIYGSVFTLGALPVQAITKGDVPILGGGSSGGGEGKDWTDYIDTGDKQSLLNANGYTDAKVLEVNAATAGLAANVDELYAVINSLEDWKPITDGLTRDLNNLEQYSAQERDAIRSDMRGNTIGLENQIAALDAKVDLGFADMHQRMDNLASDYYSELQALEQRMETKFTDLSQIVTDLKAELMMETTERNQDVNRLQQQIDQLVGREAPLEPGPTVSEEEQTTSSVVLPDESVWR